METEVAVPAHPALAEKTHRQLMQMRICDLGVTLDASGLDRYIKQLYDELDRRDIPFHPPCYLTDEWGCPDGVPVIGIPFYLADPVLVALERETMLGAEGDDPAEMMKLLRHECGHAVNYAYHVHKRREWERLFGPFDSPYPEHYRTRRFSKRYVRHLEGSYAQRHPDEDFAETFAVWLTPDSDWRRRYVGWPALRKLEYIDSLIGELAGQKPLVRARRRVEPLDRLRTKLRTHYAKKREHYGLAYPNFYDRDLRRLFSAAPEHAENPKASRLIHRIRRDVRRLVAEATGTYQYTIDKVLEDMISRADELGLRLKYPEERTKLDFMLLVAVQTMNYLHSGRHRVAL